MHFGQLYLQVCACMRFTAPCMHSRGISFCAQHPRTGACRVAAVSEVVRHGCPALQVKDSLNPLLTCLVGASALNTAVEADCAVSDHHKRDPVFGMCLILFPQRCLCASTARCSLRTGRRVGGQAPAAAGLGALLDHAHACLPAVWRRLVAGPVCRCAAWTLGEPRPGVHALLWPLRMADVWVLPGWILALHRGPAVL